MVQLRVDVEAARARTEFNGASRAVRGFRDGLAATQTEADRLNDELRVADARLAQATREFEAAERAADNAADEVRRLDQQVQTLGHAAPQALVEQLARAEDHLRDMEREEQRLRDTMEDTAHEANRVARESNDAADQIARMTRDLALATAEAHRLRDAMNDANRRSNSVGSNAQRGLLGFRQQINNLLGGGGNGGPIAALRNSIGQAWQAMPVELKGVIVGAGVAMAAFLVEAIAAAASALIITALGAAFAIGIAALAAKTSGVVQAAFKDTFKPIGEEATRFAQIAEGPLVHAAASFGAAWSDAADDVREIFQTISPEIGDLADGLSGFIREVMPGLKAGAAAAVPLLRELARSLPQLGAAASTFFTEISRGGDGLVKGLRLVVTIIGGTLIVLGQLFGFLTRQFDGFTNNLQAVLVVLAKIPGLGKLFQPAADAMARFNDTSDGSARSLDGVATSADGTALSMGRQADATSRAARAAYDLGQKMADLLGQELSLDQANLQFNQGLLDVAAAFKENGRQLDANTQKGIANREIVDQQIQKALAARQAAIDLAGGQNASKAAVDAANQKYAEQVGALEAVLRKAGLTTQQINDLIGKYREIPKNINTTITTEYRTIGSIPKDQRVGGGSIKGYAVGGRVTPGLAMVGERGPELVAFGGGERVLNAIDTARVTGARLASSDRAVALAGKASAALAPVYNIAVTAPTGSTPADVGKAVVESIKAYEKTSGRGWRTN